MKHEKRHENVKPAEATGLEVHEKTWRCFLATQEMSIPLGTFQGKRVYKSLNFHSKFRVC